MIIRNLVKCGMSFAIIVFCIGLAYAQELKISDNKRYLTTSDGSPFFWLGDTAWELIHKLGKEDTDFYLRNRAGKGYNVIQAVILPNLEKGTPNVYGEYPLVDMDPTRPNDAYFQHVDWLVNQAKEYGLIMALLPTWGSYVQDKNRKIFDEKNARAYGEYLGERYSDFENIVWVVGGDRTPDGFEDVYNAMAEGIAKTDKGNHLITFHPRGYSSSSSNFHNEKWLDFNMIQSSHGRKANDTYRLIDIDYNLDPVKPTFDAEPCYENIPVDITVPSNPRFDATDVRQSAYWSVFAGAFGYTYGHNAMFQMHRPGDTPVAHVEMTWQEAIDTECSYQMRYVKDLMLSRPFLTRIPDQSILINGVGNDVQHRQATRDGTPGQQDASYIMVYLPMLHKVNVNTSLIASEKLKSWLYDPRTGATFPIESFENEGSYELHWRSRWEKYVRPSQGGPDWVLVIDDATKNYPPPGSLK